MKSISLQRLILVIALYIGTFLCGAESLAAPLLGASIFVESDGGVVARYLGSEAAYTNDLYLESPPSNLGLIFRNQTTPVQSTVNLGSFTSGTELVFRLHVNDEGYDYFTGPGSRNPDGIPHAIVDDQFAASESYVAFEDVFGGGDFNYFDLAFSVTNTTTVPEQATLLLFSFGAAIAVCGRRRRRAFGVRRANPNRINCTNTIN